MNSLCSADLPQLSRNPHPQLCTWVVVLTEEISRRWRKPRVVFTGLVNTFLGPSCRLLINDSLNSQSRISWESLSYGISSNVNKSLQHHLLPTPVVSSRVGSVSGSVTSETTGTDYTFEERKDTRTLCDWLFSSVCRTCWGKTSWSSAIRRTRVTWEKVSNRWSCWKSVCASCSRRQGASTPVTAIQTKLMKQGLHSLNPVEHQSSSVRRLVAL